MNLTIYARRTLLVGASAFILGILLSSFLAYEYLSRHRVHISENLATLEREYIEAADQADRTAVTASSSEVVFDCEARSSFDNLLSRLETLTKPERAELLTLFPECADFYYRLKLYHLTHLENIAHEYALHLAYRDFFYADEPRYREREAIMHDVIRAEKDRAHAMEEQVIVQRAIIESLGSGSTQSAELESRIRSVEEQLGITDSKADRARDSFRQNIE